MQNNNPYAAPQSELSTYQDTTPNDKGFFSLSGRIGRLRYLAYTMLLYVLLAVVIGIPAAIVMPALESGDMSILGIIFGIIGVAAYIAFIVYGFAIAIRRFNDCDRSGWFVLLFFIPILNIIAGLYLMFAPGTKGINSFGAPPRPNHAGIYIGAFLLPVIIIGALAAIAIPAYQDYMQRSQMMQQQAELGLPVE